MCVAGNRHAFQFSAMATKFDIIRFCLARVGSEIPQSLDDDTDEMNASKILYDAVVEEILGQHAWDFARSYVALGAALTETPPDPWVAAYTIPGQFLVLRHVQDAYGTPINYQRVDGGKIYTEFEDDELCGIGLLNASEDAWPGAFVAAVKERLTAYMREAFDQEEIGIKTHERADVLERKAIGVDKRMSPPVKANMGRLLQARYARLTGRRRS